MQPPGAGQPPLAGKVEHAARRGQPRLGMLDGEVLDEALGTDARPAREQALKMMLAEVQVPGHGSEIRLARGIASEKFNGARDALVVPRPGPGGRSIY